MTAGHFIFIPSVLLVGVVIGWILGSRAARDAYAAELRRREERSEKEREGAVKAATGTSIPNSDFIAIELIAFLPSDRRAVARALRAVRP